MESYSVITWGHMTMRICRRFFVRAQEADSSQRLFELTIKFCLLNTHLT